MNYQSTRNKSLSESASAVILKGLSSEGGLFVPEYAPKLTAEEIAAFAKMTYADAAFQVLTLFLSDYTAEELRLAADNAYGGNFSVDTISNLVKTNDGVHILELWRGPTAAFKDMALQLLPYLLTGAAKKQGGEPTTAILTATSGDTGKAALEGFKDMPNTKIMVFYPENGVSDMQKLQMQTQEGGNVAVVAVRGNFDDCQNAVKAIFADRDLEKELSNAGVRLSSANSINWGRLAPQIVYYVKAYADLLKSGDIKPNGKVNFCVPTGNFGNILAAYYARLLGVPVNKLICASNRNNVLTEFINSGTYDRKREFFATASPSMDILISSNLERLLYLLSDNNDEIISKWFTSLKENGNFTVTAEVKAKLDELFYGGFVDDDGTKLIIKEVFDRYSYLLDTHTAVAYGVYKKYVEQTGDVTPTVITSTANPYKFTHSVYSALKGAEPTTDEFAAAEEIERMTGTVMPTRLKETRSKERRFTDVADKEKLADKVREFLL
ncbi:MAG: threonine synthase [Oscillospiraceae bacterium]|jgi:threonine synthase|nr:threonine synthase [Oscillospiraceae bacterium]